MGQTTCCSGIADVWALSVRRTSPDAQNTFKMICSMSAPIRQWIYLKNAVRM